MTIAAFYVLTKKLFKPAEVEAYQRRYKD